MFIAANIVFNKLVAVTILQSFVFFFLQIFMYRGAPTVRFAPVVPWAKTGFAKERCRQLHRSTSAHFFFHVQRNRRNSRVSSEIP
jgi:hypothetical protein